jgi:hypothetical protein
LIGVSSSDVGGADGVINASEFNGGVTLSGTVTGNDSVVVTIDGQTYDAVVDYDEVTNQGTWTLAVPTAIMGQGEYTQAVTVTTTDQAGNTDTANMTVEVDTLIGVSADPTGGQDGVVNATEFGGGVSLSGTVTGNDAVVVTIDGQDYDAVVSYDEVTNQGTWVLAVPTAIMGQGEYTQAVTVTTTDLAGNTSSTQMDVVVDTLIGVDTAAVGGSDGVISASEFGSGVVLSGNVTGNDAVVVTINGQPFDAVVSYDEVSNQGTWSLAVPTAIMGQGEYDQAVTVTTTDQAGNSATASMTVVVDTLIGVDANGTGGADGVINASEYGSGVVLSGSVTGNDSVVVTIDGQNYDAVVSYNETTNQGTWTLAVPTAVMGAGEYSKEVTVNTIDGAGNSDSTTTTVVVDTLIGVEGNDLGGDDSVVNNTEFGSGIVLSGTVTGSNTVVVTIDNQDFEADVIYNEGTNEGTWSLAVPTSVLGEGEYTKEVTVSTSDAAGNTDQATVMVEVDTYVNELTTTPVVSGDDLVNGDEAAEGLTLSGTVEAGSEVWITFDHPGGSIEREAETDGNGNWTITYGPGEVPEGDYTASITIDATDEHGNIDSITDSFKVDTVAPEAPGIEGVFMTPAGAGAVQIETPEQDVTIHEVTSAHQVNDVAAQVEGDPTQQDGIALGPDSMYFSFDGDLPNGSHLVVNEVDTSDNASATFVVIEETGTNSVDLEGLEGFNIGAIDLGYAQDAELTLDLATLEGLSDHDNNLIIHGSDADNDTVTLIGSGDSVRTESIDGKSYDVYTMGDDAEIFIEEGVNVLS